MRNKMFCCAHDNSMCCIQCDRQFVPSITIILSSFFFFLLLFVRVYHIDWNALHYTATMDTTISSFRCQNVKIRQTERFAVCVFWYESDDALRWPRFELHVLWHFAKCRTGNTKLNVCSNIFRTIQMRNVDGFNQDWWYTQQQQKKMVWITMKTPKNVMKSQLETDICLKYKIDI